MSRELRQIKHVALDLDGTVYKGGRLFDCSVPFLRQIERLGIGRTFLTNNSSRGRADYVRHLNAMGIEAKAGDVFTSADATVEFMREAMPDRRRLFLLGTDSLGEDLVSQGFELTEDSADDVPDAVVVAFDTDLRYARLCRAAYWIQEGKPFIATHPDLVCPTNERTVLVDCGAITKALVAATGIEPLAVPGKPHARMLAGIINQRGLAPGELAMVGDRIYTDMAMARRAGGLGVLVLSGEANLQDAQDAAKRIDLVVADLGEFGQLLENAKLKKEPVDFTEGNEGN
ncbi:MAG: HAD-IIA family hydrolase [Planctomycetota bacterium]|nr:HAD-IIA family hydrolase [Planctomycetota bacterium]